MNDEKILSFFRAVYKGDFDTVVRMIQDDPEIVNSEFNNSPPLHTASQRGNFDIVKLLVESGANVNKKGGYTGGNALGGAIRSNNIELIEYLIQNGARLDTDNALSSVVLIAAQQGKMDILYLLLKNGACADSGYGESHQCAYKMAISQGHDHIVSFLESHIKRTDFSEIHLKELRSKLGAGLIGRFGKPTAILESSARLTEVYCYRTEGRRTFITLGASLLGISRAEFRIRLSTEAKIRDAEVANILGILADYSRDIRVSDRDTAQLECKILSFSDILLLEDPDFHWTKEISSEVRVGVLELVGIYPEELQLITNMGWRVFVERLVGAGIDLSFDSQRPNLAD